MAKIAVVAANGKCGRLIVQELLDRGADLTAFVRSENKTAADKFVQKDIMDLAAEDLAPYDVVIDAFGAWTPEAAKPPTKCPWGTAVGVAPCR